MHNKNIYTILRVENVYVVKLKKKIKVFCNFLETVLASFESS